jgi:hypothetical protein
MKRGRKGSALHTGLENPKMNKNHPSYQSLIRKYGQMPGGYWHLEGRKVFLNDRALYSIYTANIKKLPNITDAAPTGLQGDGLRQDPMATELEGAEVGNPDEDDVEDLQATGDDSNKLLGLDNINEEGELGEVDAWAKVDHDLVRNTASNEKNTNILINDIERGVNGRDHINKKRLKN